MVKTVFRTNDIDNQTFNLNLGTVSTFFFLTEPKTRTPYPAQHNWFYEYKIVYKLSVYTS